VDECTVTTHTKRLYPAESGFYGGKSINYVKTISVMIPHAIGRVLGLLRDRLLRSAWAAASKRTLFSPRAALPRVFLISVRVGRRRRFIPGCSESAAKKGKRDALFSQGILSRSSVFFHC
jgi:peptidoglycan biosynthesis protein MviN/MurJ (putative lipid II flippase)